jgi:hypothetical protein
MCSTGYWGTANQAGDLFANDRTSGFLEPFIAPEVGTISSWTEWNYWKSELLISHSIRQGQPVASNPWLPEMAFHSQLCHQHQSSHPTAIRQLTTAEQPILRLELSRSAVADNPHLQQYLSTNMEDPASNAFRSWARIFPSLANSK